MSGISLMMLGPLVSAGGSVNPNAWDITKYVYQPASSKYDVTKLNGTYATPVANRNYYLATSVDTIPNGIAWRPNGLSYYLTGSGSDRVTQINCSRAWDIGSSTVGGNVSIAAQETSPNSLYFKQDGTSFYVVGQVGDRVYRYDLATPWLITSATFVNSFSVNAQDNNPEDVFFKPDGTKMYVVGSTSDSVYEYDLSTAWDITTASLNQSFSFASQDTNTAGITFNNSGTVMFILGNSVNRILRYDLSTAWDVSSASYISQSDVLSYVISSVSTTNYAGLWLDPRESVLFLVGANTDIVLFQKFGSMLTTSLGAGDLNSPQSLRFSSNGLKMYVLQDGSPPNESIYEFDLSSAYNIYTASYVQSLSISAQDTSPVSIEFKPDGTKLYLLGNSGDTVDEFSLSTAWDISSASFVSSFSISGQDTTPEDIRFSSDGIKMFILGESGNDINEYSLATAWDVSSASFVDAFFVGGQETSPKAFAFKPDGTVVYVSGTGDDSILQYNLSSAWDISTASFSSQLPVSYLSWMSGINSAALVFSNNGERLFVLDSSNFRITELSPDPDL